MLEHISISPRLSPFSQKQNNFAVDCIRVLRENSKVPFAIIHTKPHMNIREKGKLYLGINIWV